MLRNRCECQRSSDMTIINGYPVSQGIWHAIESSLHNGYKCRALAKTFSLSSVMVTFLYESRVGRKPLNKKQKQKKPKKTKTKQKTTTKKTPKNKKQKKSEKLRMHAFSEHRWPITMRCYEISNTSVFFIFSVDLVTISVYQTHYNLFEQVYLY